MFDSNQEFYGVQANYLKDLCELRGNAPDKDQHANFKIFSSYVDAYVVCPLIGYQYHRRIPMGVLSDGNAGILFEQISKRRKELRFVYQIIMLIDEDSEPDEEARIYRTFRLSESSEEDADMLAENMKIFNEYFLGGVDVLHEQFYDKCLDDDAYLNSIFEFVKKFNEELDIDLIRKGIDDILDR